MKLGISKLPLTQTLIKTDEFHKDYLLKILLHGFYFSNNLFSSKPVLLDNKNIHLLLYGTNNSLFSSLSFSSIPSPSLCS